MRDWSRGIPVWMETGFLPTDWARGVLADPHAVVLDTETTDLHGYLVEIAAITTRGRVLLNELVNPGVAISAGATRIHGIRSIDVTDAPTWDDLFPRLVTALHARHVIIYNSEFDLDVLAREVARAGATKSKASPMFLRHMLAYLARAFKGRYRTDPTMWINDLHSRTSCAMDAYGAWVGEWDDYHEHARWHPLNGGHRAAADVYAVLERLRQMAATPN